LFYWGCFLYADIDECVENPTVCRANQECRNTVGSYSCHNLITCSAGYQLNSEGSRCEGTERPAAYYRAKQARKIWRKNIHAFQRNCVGTFFFLARIMHMLITFENAEGYATGLVRLSVCLSVCL